MPGTVWPPKPFQPYFHQMVEDDAWWTGDMDTVYAIANNQGGEQATHQRNGVPYAGGVMGFVNRRMSSFWGRPINPNQRRTKLHIPLAADLASLSSDMLWAEPPLFTVSDVDGKPSSGAQDRVDLMLNSPDAHMMLNEAGEVCSALGGTYYVATWDKESGIENVCIRTHDADSGVPEFRNGRLSAVNFWTHFSDPEDDGRIFRHFERHESGAIIHALFVGEPGNVGYEVSLASLPETEWLTTLPAGTYLEDGFEITIPTGITRLTVAYQPNVKKNRNFRKMGELSYLGRSDYAGLHQDLDALDMVWSSWMLDIKAARSRIFIADAMLQNAGPGRGAYWDEEQEVFSALNTLPTQDGKNIEVNQFAIRWQEHQQTAFNLVKTILRSAGWSLSSYDEYGNTGSGTTATEIIDRTNRTETTRDKKKRYAAAATSYIGSVALELDAIVFPGMGGAPGLTVDVDFPVISQEDPLKNAQTIGLLSAAGAISIETMVARANAASGWSDTEMDDEVKLIKAEKGAPAPDPATFGLTRQIS
jgi:hypothetical protein